MTERQQNREDKIRALKDLVSSSAAKFIESGSTLAHFIPNPLSRELCQIVECSDLDGTEIPYDRHIHEKSREIFYQLRGESEFDDGTTLRSGEIKIIEPGTPHRVTLKRDGVCVVIIHPAEELYGGVSDGAH